MPEPRDPGIQTKQLESSLTTKRGRGRPSRIEQPPLPAVEMSEQEQAMQAFFVASYMNDYPDMSPTDLILLQLASYEYVKYFRILQEEFETGKVISMARQHPGVNMRALLDQMGATRKQRNVGKTTPDQGLEEARQAFLSMSQE